MLIQPGSNTIWVHNPPQKTMHVFDVAPGQWRVDRLHRWFLLSHLKLIGLACSLADDT